MPRQILGVDVGFVPEQLQFYYDSQKAAHDWRLELQTKMMQVNELAMLRREQEVDDPLWWLGIVGETVLGFFDVFDAIFTIRDVVVHGDLAALGFLAFDLLVPVIGDAVMSIRRSAKGINKWSDKLAEFMWGTENAEDVLSRASTRYSRNAAGGDPFAFGYGSRQSRAENLVNEARQVAGINDLSLYVDEVIYTSKKHRRYDGSPYFIVENGRRILVLDDNIFRRSAAGQFIITSHELQHAIDVEYYARTMFGGNADAAFSYLVAGARPLASMDEKLRYATNEVIAESLGLIRGELYFGKLSVQQMRDHLDYIEDYMNLVTRYSP